MRVLVTGGAGYIGSHTIVELLGQGHEVIVVDNLANSSEASLRRVEDITGKHPEFVQADVCDKPALQKIFQDHTPEAIIHFAGLKAVGESVTDPLKYYRTNIDSTLTLCEIMKDCGVRNLIFSSSATVYGEQPTKQYTESMPRQPINPYGQTKAMIEQILEDLAASDDSWRIIALRYFNPVGAHPSGRIGEDPQGVPNNLFPYIAQVAVGIRDKLSVFGDDYDTPDGTCIRDYIHVCDLATGHAAALQKLAGDTSKSFDAYNLGAGKGASVLEVIKAFEAASGKPVPYDIAPRRAGDLTEYYADASKANRELNWRTAKTLEDACADTWRWQSQNPNGYR